MTKVLYCGDTSLETAASYLAGLMTAWDWEYRHIPSHVDLRTEDVAEEACLIVLSDYPAARVSEEILAQIIAKVRQGCGLVMLGGWESYHGAGGDWHQTSLAEILPVAMEKSDDRVNFDQPALAIPAAVASLNHPILDRLPWEERPPSLGGLNRLTAKPGTQTLLMARVWRPTFNVEEGKTTWEHADHHPLLVVGHAGEGRVAAFASDVAPHWVGGLVDWGEDRVLAQAPGAGPVEVGSAYARFFRQLLTWAAAG